jgi:hypothetical protein
MMIVCPWGVVRVAEVSDCQLAGKDVSAASRVLAGGDEIGFHVTNPGSRFPCQCVTQARPGQMKSSLSMKTTSY